PTTPMLYALSLHYALPISADCGGSPVHVQQLCLHEFLARQLQDRLLVISKSATIIIAPRHHNGVPRQSLTDRLHAQLGKVEQDRSEEHTSELQSPCNLVYR